MISLLIKDTLLVTPFWFCLVYIDMIASHGCCRFVSYISTMTLNLHHLQLNSLPLFRKNKNKILIKTLFPSLYFKIFMFFFKIVHVTRNIATENKWFCHTCRCFYVVQEHAIEDDLFLKDSLINPNETTVTFYS